ncbi:MULTISPECIES: serine/threonine-protein kinase [unclassified Nocardioides]|uniref:serine/threonine-protein kinase n=1 Tax=unclassified Nocardioides TaxID=2615069 RepID=UPI0030146489
MAANVSGADASADAAWRPPPAPPTPPPAATEALAGYDRLTEVGQGGDSVVYRARDIALQRDVAVKVLLVDDPDRVARFRREIEITVDLGRQHPNIVNVLAVGTTDAGRPAIVMDFYEAGSLHDRLQALGPLPPEEVVKLGVVLADALAFAHDRGVLHRDVKPQNVLVLPTSWVLADFGIARLADSEHTASVETFTYRHASPQILDGLAPTPADDLWGLGSTLYTLVDGRPPFASDDPDDDSALAYLRRARTEAHRPLAVTGAERLAPVIDRCLAKDLDQRWSSAAELRDALAELRVSAWEPGGAPAAAPVRPVGPAQTPAVPPPTPAVKPVALSVLAHAPAPVRDADATGLRPAEATGARPDAPQPPAPPVADGPVAPGDDRPDPAVRRRKRLVLVLGGAALLIGLTLGIAGAALRDDEPTTTPRASVDSNVGQLLPTAPTKPLQSGPAQPQRADPELAFNFLKLTSDGSTLTLKWSEAADGQGVYTLAQRLPDPNLFGPWSGTVTTGTVSFPTVPGTRYCFVMTVTDADGGFGVSNRRCFTA